MNARQSYIIKVTFAFILSLVGTLLLITPGSAAPLGDVPHLNQDEPYRVDSFNINTPGKLNVRTSGGHITVKGSSGNTVRVEMYVQKNGRNLMPEDTDLENWKIDISQSGSSVSATAKRQGKSGWKLFGNSNNNVSISFVVHTPREMSSDLNTSGGHIEARALSGNQQISTSGGHLNLSELKGTITARTSGGHITVDGVQGELDARTSGGHIDVQDSEGSIRVKTSGGHIDLANVNGTIEGSTSGGSITADLGAIGQFVDLRTSGGNVEIRVPQNLGLDLNLKGSYVDTNLQNFSGSVDRNEVKGQLNGGGARIHARTSGGTVSLSFKQS
jgi:DUF4097 and DUF4098 domain-containing protein YvlB